MPRLSQDGQAKISRTTPRATPEAEVAQYLLWDRGHLSYKLWNGIQRKIEAKFQDCLKRRTGIMFVNCTRGGGKTFWACTKTLEYLRHQVIQRPQVFLATAFQEDLRTILTPTFEALMDDKPEIIPIEHIPSQKMYLDHETQGKAHVRGLDLKKNSLRGNYADLVIIEECQNVRHLGYIWNYVVKQLFRHRPFPMAVFIGTPPESPDHDWVEIMEIAKMHDAYVEATIDEHDMMSDEEKAFMMQDITEDAILREYYCQLVIDSTRAIVPEWDDDMVQEVERDEFFRFYHKYDSMDLGVVDQTACLFGYYDFRRSAVVVEDELIMQGFEMTTDKLAAAIRAKEEDLWGKMPVHMRVSDNDNLLLIQDLASLHKINFGCTTKDTLEAMVNELRIWVKNRRVIVHPRCKMLRGCLRSGVWDNKRKKFDTSRIYGHYDALAALIYLVRNIHTQTNPIPATYDMSEATHYINPERLDPPSGNAKQFRKLLTGIRRRQKP